jgi:hypothetical protein
MYASFLGTSGALYPIGFADVKGGFLWKPDTFLSNLLKIVFHCPVNSSGQYLSDGSPRIKNSGLYFFSCFIPEHFTPPAVLGPLNP